MARSGLLTMIESGGDDALTIRGRDQLDLLTAIPETVTKIRIRTSESTIFDGRPSEANKIDVSMLSHLPSHVKKLSLWQVVLLGRGIFAEGLEELEMAGVTLEVPLLEWIMPQSLRHFELIAKEFSDLRAVTAPAITIVFNFLRPEVDPDMNRQFLLPDSLTELTIDGRIGGLTRVTFPELVDGRILPDDYRTEAINQGDAFAASYNRVPASRATSTVIILLPPHLEHLTLVSINNIQVHGPSQLSKVKSLTIRGADEPIIFDRMFPQLEYLELEGNGQWFNREIKARKIKSLSVDYRGAEVDRRVMTIDAPLLEALTIRNCEAGTIHVIVPEVGATLVELVLDNVVNFPESEGWSRLESVMITGSSVEIPFIPHLQELELDQAQMTNGYEIRDIFEYKQAWGLATRKKRAVHA